MFFHLSCSKKDEDFKARAQVHFTHGANWTGAPAALVYNEGEYHIFYQHNPASTAPENIHWGHAVSDDLISWQLLPTAIFPDSLGQIYSGSVVVDCNNTSGYGNHTLAPFIAYYTYYDTMGKYCIAMAYSLDKGITWIKNTDLKLKCGETLDNLRSPSVSWSIEYEKWIMTASTGNSIRIYESKNGIEWNHLSEFTLDSHHEGGWLNSSLFSLVAPETGSPKWVLAISMRGGPADGAPATRYFVGDFDGEKFSLTQGEQLWIDYGKDCYGGMLFNNMPNNETVQMNWMNCIYYAELNQTKSWLGSMTISRILQLAKEEHHYIVTSNPVPQLDKYFEQTSKIGKLKLSGDVPIFKDVDISDKAFTLNLVFDNSNRYAFWSAKDYGIRLKTRSNKVLSIGYKSEFSYYYIDRSGLEYEDVTGLYNQEVGALYHPKGEIVEWRILVDEGSVELFACGGRVSLTSLFETKDNLDSIELYSKSGNMTLIEATIAELTNK